MVLNLFFYNDLNNISLYAMYFIKSDVFLLMFAFIRARVVWTKFFESISFYYDVEKSWKRNALDGDYGLFGVD